MLFSIIVKLFFYISGIEVLHYILMHVYYHFYTQTHNIEVNDHEKVEKIADNINSINEENVNIIYDEIKNHYKDSRLIVKNPLLFIPNFFFEKLILTIYFNLVLRYFCNIEFNVKYTANGIYLIKHMNDDKLILINLGIGGFAENCYDLVSKIGNESSVIITIYRSGLFNFYWRKSLMQDYCDEILKIINEYKEINMVSHSLGCYVGEMLLKCNKKRKLGLNFKKEILFEPACTPSAGLVFINSTTLSFRGFINLLNKFSRNKLFNLIVGLKFKTLEINSIINSLDNIDGIRFENWNNMETYIFIGMDDPLVNLSLHPFKHEIDIIFNNCKVILHDHYHGNFYRYQEIIYEILNLKGEIKP